MPGATRGFSGTLAIQPSIAPIFVIKALLLTYFGDAWGPQKAPRLSETHPSCAFSPPRVESEVPHTFGVGR